MDIMDHTYEEIRDVVLDLLAGRERLSGYGRSVDQFRSLESGVAEILAQREARPGDGSYGRFNPSLSHHEKELFRELFWDLFRQGIITLGSNDANPNYPFFKVTAHGAKVLVSKQPCYFYDVESYERIVRTNIPKIDDLTLLYLKEAMQAFRSGCMLAATVMLGVATENLFLSLLNVLEQHPVHRVTYQNVFKERSLLRRFNKFKAILGESEKSLSPEVKEDLDTQLAGILSIIRSYRNESGHPSGRIIDRETCYVLLQLFISYGKKMYQLNDHFRSASPAS